LKNEPRQTVNFLTAVKSLLKKTTRLYTENQKHSAKNSLLELLVKKRVQEIENEGLVFKKTLLLRALLDLYIEDKHLWDKTGRTKRYVIQMLRDCEIAKIQSNKLKTSDLIEHCKIRQTAGAKPATVYHDVCYLRAVMKKAQPVFDIEANCIIFDEALPTLIDMGLIGKSDKRTRRPTQVELDKLRIGLEERQNIKQLLYETEKILVRKKVII
jgi:hypothetical protein